MYAYVRNDPVNKSDPTGTICPGDTQVDARCTSDYFNGIPMDKAKEAGMISHRMQEKIDRYDRSATEGYKIAMKMGDETVKVKAFENAPEREVSGTRLVQKLRETKVNIETREGEAAHGRPYQSSENAGGYAGAYIRNGDGIESFNYTMISIVNRALNLPDTPAHNRMQAGVMLHEAIHQTPVYSNDPGHQIRLGTPWTRSSAGHDRMPSMQRMRLLGRAMLAAAALVSFVACAQPAEPETPKTEIDSWFQRLVDTQTRMTAYIVRLDSLRDAIELGRATPTKACDPAGMRDLYEPINEEIARLVAYAGPLQLEQDAMIALSRLEKNWISLQRRQFSRWEEVSEIKNIDLKLLCLRGGDLIEVRMEMADDQATLAKAVARRLADK